MLVGLVAKPVHFENDKYLSDRLIEALNDVFVPYVLDNDRQTAMDRLRHNRIDMRNWPVLHLLAMIKCQDLKFHQDMIGEMVTGVTDFLEHDWPHANLLIRETVRMVDALHREGLSTIAADDFVLMVTEDIGRHTMSACVLREMLIPLEWKQDAIDDNATRILAAAIIKSPELQIKLFSDIKNNRFKPALRHYPKEALTLAIDRSERWDQLFEKDLGL